MWEVVNSTPFKADYAVLRDPDGAEVWVILAKGTFTIEADGRLTLAKEQADIVKVPRYAPDGSLELDTDAVPMRPTTDVLLLGQAWTPTGRPETKVEVGMAVGPIRKTLTVSGDRVWYGRDGIVRASEPKPFVSMPLVWGRASGGIDDTDGRKTWDERNPSGTGYCRSRNHLDGKPVPNIEHRSSAGGRKSGGEPGGFGAIAPHWLPRSRLAGTYDAAWEKERMPLLPRDFDPLWYQCAPEDQQPARHLAGGERVDLVNLSERGRLRCAIPKVALGFSTCIAGDWTEHAPELHMVLLQPDVPQIVLLWHGRMRVPGRVRKVEATNIRTTGEPEAFGLDGEALA